MLLRHAPPPYLYWKSPEGEIWITAGAEQRLHPPDGDWREWLRSEAFTVSPHADLARFVVLGFSPDSAAQDPWTYFPRMELLDPSKGYHVRDGREIFIGLTKEDYPEETSEKPGRPFNEHVGLQIREWGVDEYRRVVDEGLARIRTGDLEKIVLARSVGIDLRTTFDPTRTIAALQHQPHSFGLLYSPDGERFFLSATPERLGRIRDGKFSTMALAGTHPVMDHGDDGSALLGNAKERAEHTYVVDMIRKEAITFCDDNITDTMQVLSLPHVTHILTRIEGRVRSGHGMSDVIAALHPTPAVAGTPRDVASEEIAALEAFDRGLYAGCMGWVDRNGDGDAAVTIRSAVVNAHTATAFAGAGIVEGSAPEEEERETRAKLQTMLDILGS